MEKEEEKEKETEKETERPYEAEISGCISASEHSVLLYHGDKV